MPKKDTIDNLAKRLETSHSQLKQLHDTYKEKMAFADAEMKKAVESPAIEDVPVMQVMVNVGIQSYTVDEFNATITRMQRSVNSKVNNDSLYTCLFLTPPPMCRTLVIC